MPPAGGQPQYRPRGIPREIVQHRRAHGQGRGWREEQWKAHHNSPGVSTMPEQCDSLKAEPCTSPKIGAVTRARRRKDPWGTAGKSTTYGLLGQNPIWNPGWVQPEHGVPEKYLCSASPTFPNDAHARTMTAQEHAEFLKRAAPGEGAGDYSLGVRGPGPRISSTYQNFHRIPNWKVPEVGNPHKHHTHSNAVFPNKALSSGTLTEAGQTYARTGEAGVCSGPLPKSSSEPTLSPGRGNQTKGFRGPEPHFASSYSFLGRVPGFRNASTGFPVRHQHHSVDCHPELNKPYIEALQEAAGPLAHGDHSRGIKGRLPHFTSTYMDLGQVDQKGIPNGKHYDFDDNANRCYRFTFWEDARKDAERKQAQAATR